MFFSVFMLNIKNKNICTCDSGGGGNGGDDGGSGGGGDDGDDGGGGIGATCVDISANAIFRYSN